MKKDAGVLFNHIHNNMAAQPRRSQSRLW